MKTKTMFIALLAMSVFFASAVYAYDKQNCPVGNRGNMMCGKGGGMCCQKGGGMCQKDSASCCPIMAKLMKKSGFILKHQSELGLTDEQVKTIKDIQLQAEKDKIQKTADKELFMVDLKSILSQDTIDVQAANALIDKNAANMSAGAKAGIAAYAKLKSTLTPEQVTKMKDIWKNKEAQGHKGR
jgi:Spy/CpxP family protein refolding chaperone